MRLLFVNPNTTAAFTRKIGEAAQAVAAPGVSILAVNPADGPVSIEGPVDEAYSVPGLLAEIRRAGPVDGVAIACFDDTGLDAARSVSAAPVVGIGEAAFHMASLIAHRFSVVTTLARSVPIIENNLQRYGLAARCGRVRASDIPVLALEQADAAALDRIGAEIERAKADDGAEAIVLGCAGMADLPGELAKRHGLPVLDGVACAVKLLEALAGLGLRTARGGLYAPPLPKVYAGRFAGEAPN